MTRYKFRMTLIKLGLMNPFEFDSKDMEYINGSIKSELGIDD